MKLSTPLTDAGRVYKMYAKRLEKLEIQTLFDFLYHLPTRYEDYSHISHISDLQENDVVTVQGTILEIKNENTKKFRKIQRARVQDATGVIPVMWFGQPFLVQSMKQGDKISLSGRVQSDFKGLLFVSPDYEIMYDDNTLHTGRLVPIYPETKGVSSKWLRRQVWKLLQEHSEELEEYLPSSLIDQLKLENLIDALQKIHFPNTLDEAQIAKHRLAFDEVFLLQLSAKERRAAWKHDALGNAFAIAKYQKQIQDFWESLPFELTNAQKNALKEIFADVEKNLPAGRQAKPMNRLLEGDVGSGKTVVAAIAMYVAYLNGYQSAFMAPTQILAAQHFETIKKLLEPFHVRIGLQTGDTKGIRNKELGIKKKVNEHNSKFIIHNSYDILVGTHALLSQKVSFDRLGLVVIDEQQRFGVEQRALLKEKGENPHLLTMTATPIPRTVALTLYGDLDLSILDEMPKGRKEIKTWLVPKIKREGAYQWIEKQAKGGDQIFIVCPFIEESETMTTIKAASKEFERLQKDVFQNLKLGLLHGKMKAKEKDVVLEKFRKGDLDILVATPVVEVGIDIPNATVIVIEASERFGLSGLHQLRGRVGRGDKQSYCLLFTESSNPQTLQRLKSLEHIHNGPELAELDLKLRGAGELYGTLQHGTRWLKIASFSDLTLIEQAKIQAEKIFPDVVKYPKLKEKLQEINVTVVSPD